MNTNTQHRTRMLATRVLVPAALLMSASLSSIAFAAKGGKGGNDSTKDTPTCVVVEDQINEVQSYASGVSSDGGGPYCDSKKDHISAFLGRRNGQCYLNTNTNNGPGGSTLVLSFADRIFDLNPIGAPEHLFDVNGVVMPTSAELITRRPGKEGGVDLRTMAIGETTDIALRIRFVITDVQNAYQLNYRMGNPDLDVESYLDATDLLAVTRLDESTWVIFGGTVNDDPNRDHFAYLWRVVDNQWNHHIPVGIYSMPLMLTITIKD